MHRVNRIRDAKEYGSLTGFTLIELLVSCFLIVLLGLSMVSVLKIGLKTFQRESKKSLLQDQARIIGDIIYKELNQGIINPDPGGTNPATGYKILSPGVTPTAVIYPNNNGKTANYVEFNEPNYAYYNLSSATFNAYSPQVYKKIKYYVSGSALYRSETTYNSNGSVNASSSAKAAQLANGTITLQVTYKSATKFEIKITIVSGLETEILTTNAYISST